MERARPSLAYPVRVRPRLEREAARSSRVRCAVGGASAPLADLGGGGARIGTSALPATCSFGSPDGTGVADHHRWGRFESLQSPYRLLAAAASTTAGASRPLSQ
jgi:hypothetical protein